METQHKYQKYCFRLRNLYERIKIKKNKRTKVNKDDFAKYIIRLWNVTLYFWKKRVLSSSLEQVTVVSKCYVVLGQKSWLIFIILIKYKKERKKKIQKGRLVTQESSLRF